MIHATKKRLWYLSGGMTKFGADNYEVSNKWRHRIKGRIYEMSDGQVMCFNPNEHFSMQTNPEIFTDREAMNLDIYKLRNSELLIYRNNDPYSRGSMIEFGIAWERNIPILTLNDTGEEIHPWVREMSEKVFTSESALLSYLEEHYLRMD